MKIDIDPERGGSLEHVAEFPVGDPHVHPPDGLSLHHAAQEPIADARQDGSGEVGVDHATAALRLGAALGDELDHLPIVAEGNV
jgi:hypothetical protein